MLEYCIGFIGAGQMATALGRAFAGTGLIAPDRLLAADPSPDARTRFAQTTGGRADADNLALATAADVLFLAVKAQQVPYVLRQLHGRIPEKCLVASIAAGLTLATLAKGLGERVRLVRVMPNTPCLVAQGACGYCLGGKATPDDARLVEQLLGAVGLVCAVDEKLMDAVTGLSGCGPAFVYLMIEALIDGGVSLGLPRATATALAAQTVRGAAAMVLESGEHPAVLKDRVASPGGSTLAGLRALESGGLRAALIEAVEAAARRSAELGAVFSNVPE